jgi:hypothetical protein
VNAMGGCSSTPCGTTRDCQVLLEIRVPENSTVVDAARDGLVTGDRRHPTYQHSGPSHLLAEWLEFHLAL